MEADVSADNVTPFKGKSGGETPGEPPSGDSPQEPQIGLSFRDEGEEEPCSLRLWQALRAVCSAAEEAGVAGRDQEFVGLGTAADILSRMLDERIA